MTGSDADASASEQLAQLPQKRRLRDRSKPRPAVLEDSDSADEADDEQGATSGPKPFKKVAFIEHPRSEAASKTLSEFQVLDVLCKLASRGTLQAGSGIAVYRRGSRSQARPRSSVRHARLTKHTRPFCDWDDQKCNAGGHRMGCGRGKRRSWHN